MDRVRVAMIGCGGFQRYRLGNLLQIKEAEVAALVDPEPQQIAMTCERHGVLSDCLVFVDYRKMLDEVRPDAVMIATPHTQHVDQILNSLDAGAHVLCEKPLVTSVEDAHRVIAKRDETGKLGMVSYQRHFQPEFRAIRERIQNGTAGKVQFITVLQSQEWKRATKGTWRQVAELSGGGQLNDSGSHVIDIILWVTGQSPASVAAFSDNLGTPVDINSSLSVLFKGGAMANIGIVGDGHAWHEDITIWCEKESYFVRDGKLTIVNEKQDRYKAEHLSGGSTPDRNFVDSILGKAEIESPFECGLEVIRLTEAAWQSATRDGAPVAVTA